MTQKKDEVVRVEKPVETEPERQARVNVENASGKAEKDHAETEPERQARCNKENAEAAAKDTGK